MNIKDDVLENEILGLAKYIKSAQYRNNNCPDQLTQPDSTLA